MLSLIISFFTSTVAPVLKNPKVLIPIAAILFVFGIWLHGCSTGKESQKERDASTITELKAKIDSIEHAPVHTTISNETSHPIAEPTKPLSIIGKRDSSAFWRQRADSLEKTFGDSLGRWRDFALQYTAPFDSITQEDSLKVDSSLVLKYRLRLGADPLDRLLQGQLLPQDISLKRFTITSIITMPPEPKWYDYTPLGWIVRFFQWVGGL